MIKKLLPTIIFLLIALFVWVNIHEFFHILALKSQGFDFNYKWNILIPQVQCLNCETANTLQILFYTSLPYIIDLFAMFIGWLFFKNIWLRYFLHFGYFDIFSNYITLIFYFFNRNLPHDFVTLVKIGYGYLPILLFVISTLLWFKLNWQWLIKEINNFKTDIEH